LVAPSLATGIWYFRVWASIFSYAWLEERTCQSPGTGSMTVTVWASVLWLRSAISHSTS